MKESEKRLRLTVVEYALRHCQEMAGTKFTRRDIFMLPSHEIGNREIENAAAPASWQKSLLERFVKSGVLNRHQDASGALVSYTANSVKIMEILTDHKKGGLTLSWYVFPGEVTLPTKASEKPVEEEEEEEEQEEEKAVETTPAKRELISENMENFDITTLDHLTDRELQVRHIVLSYELVHGQNRIFDALSRMVTLLVTTAGHSEGIAKAQNLDGIDEGVKALKNKTNALQAHQNEMLAVLNAIARKVSTRDETDERHSTTPEELAQLVKTAIQGTAVEVDPKVFSEIKTAVSETAREVSKVLKAVNAKEEDRVGHALKQIADMKRDLTAVEDLLTEHMVKT